MRIGIFTDTYTPYISGLVTSELMLKDALEQKGHEVYVVTANLKDYKFEYDEKEKIVRIPGIPTGIYDSRLTGIYPLQAINIIRNWHLDVIHSQTEFGVGTFARIFAKQFNVPIVHTYHTMYEDYVYYITKGHFDRSSKKLVEYLTKFYCDKTITELIVPTKKAYDLFKEKYNVQRNIHIIPTGMEIERFYPENFKKKELDEIKARHNLTNKDFVIISVGRIGKEKNIDFLLRVQKSLSQKEPRAKLLIVGDGPDMEHYKEMVKEFNIENSVIFTGKVKFDDVPKYYNISNLFMTASHTETQGLTVMEAIASTLPALCINDESFITTVINGLNGYIFENEEDAEEKIIKIMNDKRLQKELARGARTSADTHSSKYFAERVLDVYQKAIDTQNAKLKSKFLELLKKVKFWKK